MSKNHNAIGNNATANDGKTGWEGVAAEAGKMSTSDTTKDAFDRRIETEFRELQVTREEKAKQAAELRYRAAELAKPSGIFYANGGLDVSEAQHDGSKLIRQADSLGKELGESRARYDLLSSEEGRRAEAQRIRNEAENYEKFYTQGIKAVGIAELQDFDQRISAETNPDARKKIEEAKNKYIEEVVLPAGQWLAEQDAGEDETQEEDSDAEGLPVEKAEGRTADTLAVAMFAEKINPEALRRTARRERLELDRLQRQVARYDESSRHSIFEQKAHQKNLRELKRYGYNTNGENSLIFKEILNSSKSADELGALSDLGKARARNWKRLELALKSDSGKQLKKDLKKAGFNKLPETWSDENFTSDEMNRMAMMAISYQR